MEDSEILFCSSKFVWARETISSKFIGSLGTRPQSGSPVLRKGTGNEDLIEPRISALILSHPGKNSIFITCLVFYIKSTVGNQKHDG